MKCWCYILNNSCGLDDRLWHLEFTHIMRLAVLLRNTMLYYSMLYVTQCKTKKGDPIFNELERLGLYPHRTTQQGTEEGSLSLSH